MAITERSSMQSVDDYFARLPSSECAQRCVELADAYYLEALRSGRLSLYRTSYYDYFESFIVRGQLYRKGRKQQPG